MMIKRELLIEGVKCIVYKYDEPKWLLIQAVDDHDIEKLDTQIEYMITHCINGFVLVAFKISNWTKDLSPWVAKSPFKQDDFGSGAKDTLSCVVNHIIPNIKSLFSINNSRMKICIGGYSLSALFALWCGYVCADFDAVAAASPSVWIDKWGGFITNAKMNAPKVYLSLGDREAETKNKMLQRVITNIKLQYETLKNDNIETILVFEQGNHFKDSDIRTAKAFVWIMQ